MRSRPGFAPLVPLAVLTGLAAGTFALLSNARPVQAPGPALQLRREQPVVARVGDE